MAVGVIVWLPLLLFRAVSVSAAEPDTVVTQLHEIVVSNEGNRAVRVTPNGNMHVSVQSLKRGIRVMGEADILGVLKRTAGISSVGDYGSGPVIMGGDPSQNLFRINGAPVFFPYRFGGIFSTFNSSHFSVMDVERFARRAGSPNRLGAIIDVAPSLQYDRALSGSLNVGLLASSLTLKGSVANRVAMTVSGRLSYVDRLYGSFLNRDQNSMSYRFSDINASVGWRVDSLNTIKADFFTNSDNIFAGNKNYGMETRLGWQNRVGSISWQSSGRFAPCVNAWYSDVHSSLTVAFPQYDVLAPNNLRTIGLFGSMNVVRGRGFIPSVTVGLELNGYAVTPMYARMTGALARTLSSAEAQRGVESRLFADALFTPSETFSFSAGLSGSLLGGDMFTLDPRVSATLRSRGNTITISVGRFTQYLHNVGFSEIGLASNFWHLASHSLKPQHSIDFTASWAKSFLDDMIGVNCGAYYKIVKSQSEYYGQILDVLDSDFNLSDHIAASNGYNVGVEAGVSKRYGSLTGSVAYAFGRAMRRNVLTGEMFHAITDAGHQLKADVDYVFNSHWSVGAAFVYASGRVYTPTRYLYIISNRLITEYGSRNSARLPDYQRLDLSATYRFKTGGRFPMTHIINLSVINAYGHRNIEHQYFAIDGESLRYELFQVASMYRFLPSLSYSIDF